jgi:hypothetical protein
MKEKKINIDKILRNNRKVNSTDLARNLKALGELKKNGVNIGPDYQLGSPFSRPSPRNSKADTDGSILKSG